MSSCKGVKNGANGADGGLEFEPDPGVEEAKE